MVFYSLVIALAFSSASFAQKPKKLETEWLAKDVKSIELITKLMPLENQTSDIHSSRALA